MSDNFTLTVERLSFPALFTPSNPFGDDGSDKFRVSGLISSEQVPGLPVWLQEYAKEPRWQNAPTGKHIVNMASLFRVPVFGLPDDFIPRCEHMNFDPDRLLAMNASPGRVIISRQFRNRREFVNLMAVEFTGPILFPTFDTIESFIGGFR